MKKMIFKGVGIDPDGKPIKFNSKDDYFILDGYKLDSIGLAALLRTEKDVDKLIEYLSIVKYCLSHNKETVITADMDALKRYYDTTFL